MPGAEPSIADTLRASSWEQGSLLPPDVSIPISAWAHPDRQAAGTVRRQVENLRRKGELTKPALVHAFPEKPHNRLLVISQTCDVIKPPEFMPTAEVAIAFPTENDRKIAEASNFASARYYRLTPPGETPALVLDYGWREHLDKGFLLHHAPDNSILDGWDRGNRKTFAHWLGRRSSRPVLSDADVSSILDPLRVAWEQFIDEEPDLARQCTEHYAELRFRRDDDGTLWFYVISASRHPDETLGLEVSNIVATALKPHHPAVRTDVRTYESITMAEYLATEQIDFEWASHREGEAIGEVAGL